MQKSSELSLKVDRNAGSQLEGEQKQEFWLLIKLLHINNMESIMYRGNMSSLMLQ